MPQRTKNPSELLIAHHHKELLNAVTNHLYVVTIYRGTAVKIEHQASIGTLTGYLKEEFDSKPELWQHILHAKDADMVNLLSGKAFNGEKIDPLEYRIVHRDGTIRWVRDTLIVHSNDEGYPVSCIGLIKDITRSKETELARKYSDHRYKRLVGLVADYIYTVKVEKGFPIETYHGPGCIAITGYSSEDFLNDNDLWYRMVYVDDREHVAEQAQLALTGDVVPSLEHRIIHRDGHIRWVKNYIVVEKDKNGDVISYDGIIRDITRRKVAEISLRESEQRYKRLLRSVTDYIYTVFVEDGIAVDTHHGPGCVSVTGYAPEDFEENESLWLDIIYPEDLDIVAEREKLALAGSRVKTIEHRIIHKDGSKRWVRNTIVIRYDPDGNIKAYDGLIADITERKQAEEFAELQRQQLIQADKMSTLGILVTGVAHEINNPNNFILLNAKILSRGWEDVRPILEDYYKEHGEFLIAGMPYSQMYEKINQLIAGLSKGAWRIQKIVESLKDFARQDKGEFSNEVDINNVVKAAIMIVNNLIKKSSHKFLENYAVNLPKVKGNFQQLEQVVINLLTNACQALPNPGKALSIKTGFDQRENNLTIKVCDEGVGLDEQELKHIFDPFFTTKRDTGGTGLGLSISYRIIKDHGGTLTLNSTPGKGSTAIIKLPVEEKVITQKSVIKK